MTFGTFSILMGIVALSYFAMLTYWQSSKIEAVDESARAQRLKQAMKYIYDGKLDQARALAGADVVKQALDHFADRYVAGELTLEDLDWYIAHMLRTVDKYEP